ncbi:hypothetical protein TNCV_1780561 [Trichonephila clavipes]|nr:hypothetical protein TNCV_1780561 [Trichonephila clavipes]
MKRAIWAIYFPKLSTEDNPQHDLCPLGEYTWSQTGKKALQKTGTGRDKTAMLQLVFLVVTSVRRYSVGQLGPGTWPTLQFGPRLVVDSTLIKSLLE